jgi:hypothetical protein
MSQQRPLGRKHRLAPAAIGQVPTDLFVPDEAWPRAGRPLRHDPTTWTVTDDWPQHVPVTVAEVGVFEAWFGDLFDELFGAIQ